MIWPETWRKRWEHICLHEAAHVAGFGGCCTLTPKRGSSGGVVSPALLARSIRAREPGCCPFGSGPSRVFGLPEWRRPHCPPGRARPAPKGFYF